MGSQRFNFEEIIGQSPALREVLRLVETVAASDSTVLCGGDRYRKRAHCPRSP